jgi:hypothetical protein
VHGKNKYHRLLLNYISDQQSTHTHEELESFFWIHRGFAAIVRLLFRIDVIPNMREHLCVLAGRFLQKKEVCNEAGAYSSQRQRSDVVQELSSQVRCFMNWLDYLSPTHIQELLKLLDSDEWIFYVIDHTALPVTLSHIRSPPVRVQPPVAACPHCSASLEPTSPEHKRRREVERLWQ